MASKELFDALKALFEKSAQGKPLPMVAPVEAPGTASKEKTKVKKVDVKKAPDASPEAEKPKVQDTEVVRKAMIRAGQEAGAPLSAEQKMTVLVSDQFRSSVPVENQRLLGGISRLSPNKQPPEINWSTPTAEEWAKVRSILKDMPQMTGLSDSDQMVLREVRQTAYEWGYRNWDAIKAGDKPFHEAVQNDMAFKGATAERIFKDEQVVYHVAHSAQPENTQAWAEELEQQILDDFKAGPEITRTVSPERANKKAQEVIKITRELSWLVKDGEVIKDPNIAQVVYDIANAGEDAWTREFLLAKGAQIKALGAGSSSEQMQELDKFRKRFAEEVANRYHNEVSPEAGNRAEDVLEAIGTAGTSRGRGRARRGAAPAAGGDVEISKSMLKGLKGPKKDIEDFKRAAEAFNIRTRVGGAEADAHVAYFVKSMDDERFVILLDKSPALKAHMTILKEKAREWLKNQNFSKEVERGWSSLYLSYEEMKQAWRSPEAVSSMWQDRANSDAKRGVYESEWQDASKRNYSQLIQYISSADFQRHRIAYLQNPENWKEIFALSGEEAFVVNAAGERVFNENHTWYREVHAPEQYQVWRDTMADRIRARGDLNRLQIAIQTDVEMDKIKGLYADFGDAGYPLILNERNGLNLSAFEVFKERGASIIYDENGNIRALKAGDLIQLEKEVVRQMWEHKELYEGRFNEWDGSIGADANGDVLKDARGNIVRRAFSKADIEAAVTEVSFLVTVTGQRAQLFGKAATPLEMMHQKGNPMEFGSQPAEGKILFAMSPFKWLMDRWALKSDFAALVMRNMFQLESTRVGIDTIWRTRLDQLASLKDMPTPEGQAAQAEWGRLVKTYFNINDLGDANAVQQGLSVLRFRRGAMGERVSDKIKFAVKHFGLRVHLEGEIRDPPATLGQLTKDDLFEQILYREGRRLLDARISGAYHIIDSGWQIGTQKDALSAFGIYKDGNGVLLHETARLDAGALYDTSADHHSVDHATDHLKHHTFKLMGKFDPIASIDALATKMHGKTFGWFKDHAPTLNIFKDASMGEQSIHYDPNRPEAFVRDTIRAVSMRRSMIDTELTLVRVKDPATGKMVETPQGPIDYSKWAGDLNAFSPQERTAILKICAVTGDQSLPPEANAKAYLDVMKAASEYALRPETIDDLASPVYAVYFTTVNKIDPRVKFIDGIKDGNPDHMDHRLQWSNNLSAIPGGHGTGGGFARWAGDTQNSVKGLGEHLMALLEAKDTKTFLMHFKPFVDTIAFSGGQSGAKAPVGQTLFYGWSQAVLKDVEFDLAGIGDATTMDISPAQRAAGQGIPALSRIDLDHLGHEVEAAIGQKFHSRMHNFTVKMEKKFGIAMYIGNKRIIPTVRLYNLHAFALVGGALIAMGAFSSAKKGLSGSGGGSDEHHAG